MWAAVVLLVGGLSSLLTVLVAVSHYRSEHTAAMRDRAVKESLMAENDRLHGIANEREARVAALAAQVAEGKVRLERKREDLRFAITRFNRMKSQANALRSRASSLQDDLAAANAKAEGEYGRGYEAGLAAAQPPAEPPPSGDGCDPNYQGACVPTSYGDVDCGEIPETDFYVVGDDVDGLDGDGDGIACES